MDGRNSRFLAMVLNLFMVFLCKLLSFFRILNCRKETRSDNIHPLDTLNPNPDPIDNPTVETIKEDHIHPCLERLQRLETLCSEISSRPAEIPLENERILLDSWDRIKSIECDLEKTKKVLHSTIVKQMQIEESLEAIQYSNIRRRRFC